MRSVFVTGASTGIGRDAVLRMSALGWRTFAGVRSDEAAASLEAASNGTIEAIRCDITDHHQVTSAVESILSATGGLLTGLVNNAGIAKPGPLESIPIDDLRQQLEVNVIGHVAVTQKLLPALHDANGRVVNIGSVSGMYAAPLIGAYAMSKFAIEAMSDSLRRELALTGVRVSLIQAGSIDTPIWDKTLRESGPMMESMTARQRGIYGPGLDALANRADNPGGDPVTLVTNAIEHALTSRSPKIRYRIGSSTRLVSVLRRIFPDRALDQLARFR